MRTSHPLRHNRFISWVGLIRGSVFLALAAVIIFPLFPVSSASLLHRLSARNAADVAASHVLSSSPSASGVEREVVKNLSSAIDNSRFEALLPMAFAPAPPMVASIETYNFDCTVLKNSFNLGETVCLKIVGEPIGEVGRPVRRIAWVSPYGSVAQAGAVTSDPQFSYYPIPSDPTQTFTDEGGGTVTVDNRGTWTVLTLSAADGSRRLTANFTVHDPLNPFVDLSVTQSVTISESQVSSGSGSVFEVFVTNNGPEAATGVLLTDVFSDNTRVTSVAESAGGPGFDCGVPDGNVFTCTLASMPAGSKAHLTVAYSVNEGTPAGAAIPNTVSISSSGALCLPGLNCELQPDDNSSTVTAEVPATAGGQTCSLNCHENMAVVASATQGGNPGAFVNFGAASGIGNCGAITATFPGLPPNQPASGAFFPVGTTVVSVSSESGGGSCSFTVTVVEGTPPAITCPVNKVVTAAPSATSAAVATGTPTTNPASGVTVVGTRSDDPICTEGDDAGCTRVPLTDPYPLGTTTIAWTVIDSNGLSSTCTQKITVNENTCGDDAVLPTITAPADLIIGTGPGATGCGVGLDDELGLADAQDNCSVSVTTSGIPANNFFPVGSTTVTYTATDGSGNQASDTQIVTVFDNTPPIIAAPANATYTCLSQVPAASPSQATRGVVFDENGNQLPPGPPFDNCGMPVVTVTETSSGAGSAASPRIITRTFTATDTSPLHNSSSSVQTITVIDATPPTITCPANIVVYLPLNSTATSNAVNFSVSATDNCSGVGVVSTPASGSVFPMGTTTVNSTATDAAGNTASCSFTVTVLYNFTGFFSPINNLPTLNAANAGKNIPVKFSLSGNKGLSIFAADNPYSVSFNCANNDPGVDIVETNNPGQSTLSYSPDTYHYNWKTESSWAGTCRQLRVTLNDGSVHVANFKFK